MNSISIFFLLLLSPAIVYAEPAQPGTILTFYISDINLSTDHRAVMTIPTAGLVDFTINGIPVAGPDTMVETGIDTGVFQVQLTLPETVGGKPLQDGDVVVMTYHQAADYSGNPSTLTQSKVLTSAPSSPLSSSSSHIGIGHYFKLRIYAPDYNLDSLTPDDIPLDLVEFHMGGLQTTLADPGFQTNPYTLRETGPDTNTFEVNVKLPQSIDGQPIELGSTIEFRFNDRSFPSSIFATVGSSGVIMQNNVVDRSPSILNINTANQVGTNVNFANSSILYGFNSAVCDPASGSFFNIGRTTVTCAATDQNKNSVVKTFVINVIANQNSKPNSDLIPQWIIKPIQFWCNGELDYDQLHSALHYVASKGIVAINGSSTLNQIPDKTSICLWADGKISEQSVSQSIYLISR